MLPPTSFAKSIRLEFVVDSVFETLLQDGHMCYIPIRKHLRREVPLEPDDPIRGWIEVTPMHPPVACQDCVWVRIVECRLNDGLGIMI